MFPVTCAKTVLSVVKDERACCIYEELDHDEHKPLLLLPVQVAFIDTEGTFRAEKIRAIATRFDLDADAVLDNVSPCLCGFSIKYCSGMHTGDVDDEGDACMRRSSMPGRTRMRRR